MSYKQLFAYKMDFLIENYPEFRLDKILICYIMALGPTEPASYGW